jgi:hypothetical protein
MIHKSPIYCLQPAVKDTAAWAIGRVCDTCEGIVTREQTLTTLLPALSNALQDQPRVATNVCWASFSSLFKNSFSYTFPSFNVPDAICLKIP